MRAVVWHNEGMTVKAIYENGVFRPTEPVDIAERTPVEVIVPGSEVPISSNQEEPAASPGPRRRAPTEAMEKIYQILSRSYDIGQTDLAERHDENQP